MLARLVLPLLIGALLLTSPVRAQGVLDDPAPSVIWKPMSPPPPKSPAGFEPSVREPRHGRYAPTQFSVAPGSDRMDLAVYREHGVNPALGSGGSQDNSTFLPLCTLPCEVTLRPRSYVFGVTAGNRAAIKVTPIIDLRKGQQVAIDYDSRLGVRILGWTLLLAGSAAGGLLMASGLPAGAEVKPGRVAGGAVVTAVGLAFGLWFANLPDRARAWLVPAKRS